MTSILLHLQTSEWSWPLANGALVRDRLDIWWTAALNDNSVRVCADHFRKGGIKPLVRSGYRNRLNLNASSTAGKINLIKNKFRKQRITAISENGHPPRAWQHVVKQFNAF